MASTAERKSKVLVIGALEYIGKFMAIASVKLGHPTLVLLPSFHSADPDDNLIIQSFIQQGVTLFKGDIYNHARLVQAISAVDVVISTVGCQKVMDQTRIIAAIQEAGNIRRFIPYEAGINVPYAAGISVNRYDVLQHPQTGFEEYVQMRQLIEQSGVPHTYVVWNFCAGNFLGHSVNRQSQLSVPLKLPLLGDGNTKVVFTAEKDIGLYTILAADDPRTLNKSLYIRPPENIVSLNELLSLWERKVNRKFVRRYCSEERILKCFQEANPRGKTAFAIIHAAFIRGVQTNFEIDPSIGVEASQLYPHINYTTLSEFLDRFIPN
ncbi:Isoflavone reductase-like protein [Rhynchospora pubera]|uniref:Isoflavone reductase-like protein n=1 Tax=Rhynchospora pubera TaxID=906938 RepID=A0AAV8DL13_9POAL|nr:Isoflavone reductase-like protein [Rhynchospora pubera]